MNHIIRLLKNIPFIKFFSVITATILFINSFIIFNDKTILSAKGTVETITAPIPEADHFSPDPIEISEGETVILAVYNSYGREVDAWSILQKYCVNSTNERVAGLSNKNVGASDGSYVFNVFHVTGISAGQASITFENFEDGSVKSVDVIVHKAEDSQTTTTTTTTTTATSPTTTTYTTTTSATESSPIMSTAVSISDIPVSAATTTAATVNQLDIGIEKLTLENGEQYAIKANQDNLTFKSNNKDVAIVSKTGIITALGEGKAIISVINSDDDVKQIKLTVVDPGSIGDCNGDGVFNIADVVLLQKWILNSSSDIVNWKSADIVEDELLNVFDLCLLKRRLTQQY